MTDLKLFTIPLKSRCKSDIKSDLLILFKSVNLGQVSKLGKQEVKVDQQDGKVEIKLGCKPNKEIVGLVSLHQELMKQKTSIDKIKFV